MDRELSTRTIAQDRIKSIAKIVVPLLVLVVVAVYAGGLMNPSLEATKIRTAPVQSGGIEGMLEATGVVVPELDVVMTSPVEARVLKVLRRAGDSVRKGDAVVELDVRGAELSLEKLTDNIALKRNAEAQLKATLTAKLQQLENTIRIKRREIEADSNNVEQNRKLFEKGYLSAGEFQKFIIQAKKSADELDALLKDYRNAQISSALQQEGVALEVAMLQKDKTQSSRDLEQASAKAEQNGVVTWVVQTVGAQVRKGEMMARIADLTSFRLDATISDIHRNRLTQGMPVRVSFGGGTEALEGFISGIQPTVENGVVRFTVALGNNSLGGKAHPALKPNARADVGVVIAQSPNTLFVKRGAFFRGEGETNVYVVRSEGAKRFAVKTRVVIGIANSEYCEIRSGVQAGDVIILSDMKSHEQHERITIEK
jgi:HlyD family secretion protein